MKLKVAILFTALATTGLSCKKGGGGGGGWLVGTEGLMAQVDERGHLGQGYELGDTEQLNGIACRYQAEAWVVGNGGTLLYTSDAGKTWSSQNLDTTANLRSLATQDGGAVFVVGDGVFFTARPAVETGAATWSQLGDGSTNFVKVAAAQDGTTVLAVSTDGGLWSYENAQLVKRTTLAGMSAVAVSADGQTAYAAGHGLYRSFDAGQHWSAIAVDPAFNYADIRVEETGEAVAVGDNGIVSRIDNEGRVLTQHVGSANLRTLHIAPSDDYTGIGYAAGDDGQVFMTEDSGWTWKLGPNVGHQVLGVDEIGDGHN